LETLLAKLAVAGAILSLLLHVASFTQFSPLEMNPILFLILIGGMLLLWGGTRRVYRKLGVGLSFLERCSLRFAPRPARTLYRIIFLYSGLVIFFLLAVLLHGGKPSRIDGRPVLLLLDNSTRQISENQYERYRSYQLGILTAFCMVSYSFTAAVQYSAIGHTERVSDQLP
jgi:hypothetical protein